MVVVVVGEFRVFLFPRNQVNRATPIPSIVKHTERHMGGDEEEAEWLGFHFDT